MMIDIADNPALLIIDVQQGLAEPSLGLRNNPDAEDNMSALLGAWREHGLPIIHIRHCSVEPNSPLRPELPGNAYKDEVRPLAGEKEFTKAVNSAFIGTGLEQYLRESGISRLVIIGLTTDHCVSSSTRMASNLGFDVTLVLDATAAFERVGYDGVHYSGEEIHRINLVSLDREFCVLRSTTEVLSEIQA
jgi:nicotinamidase-related amidase